MQKPPLGKKPYKIIKERAIISKFSFYSTLAKMENNGNHHRRPLREAPWDPDFFTEEIATNARNLLDEILGRVARDGIRRTDQEIRALLDEQLNAKSRAVEMAGRIIGRWDADRLRSMIEMFPVEVPQINNEVPLGRGNEANHVPENAARANEHNEGERSPTPAIAIDHGMEWAPSSDDE